MATPDGLEKSDVICNAPNKCSALNPAEDALDDSATVEKLSSQPADALSSDTNSVDLSCLKCSSLVLRKGIGSFCKNQFALPQMDDRPGGASSKDSEVITDFWVVDDMFKFENVGFSNTIEHTKYLVCADCECGPIGWQDIRHKMFYVACSRVAQQ